jgi:hypothetical protein
VKPPGSTAGIPTGDTATIVQESGANDRATQEQARFLDPGDNAYGVT